MGMKNLTKKNLVIVIFVISLLSITNIKSCFGESYSTSLSYLDYFAISSEKEIGKAGGIKWEFTGNNPYVGILVRIYDDYNYNEFLEGNHSAQRYVVSDGSYYIASGVWAPPKTDVWHIVFLHHHDSSETEITSVNIEVVFVTGALTGGLLAVIIGVPILFNIGIVVLVIVLVKRKKKQQVLVTSQNQQDPQTSPSSSEQQSPIPSNVRYCKDCGQENIDVSTYCKKCGSKLDA